MKKFYKFITQSLALIAIITLFITSQAFGQLNVKIFFNGLDDDPINSCFGTNTFLNSEVTLGSGDYTYTWTCVPAIPQFLDLGADALFTNTTPVGSYTVTLDVEDNLSTATGTKTITVIINPRPLSNIVANGPTEFCIGGSVELEEINNQPGVNYQWLRGGVDIPGQTNDTYNAFQSGSYRVRVSYASTGCFLNSSAISVTVNPLPVPSPINNSPICDGDDLVLNSVAGMTNYEWSFGGSVISDQQSFTIFGATSVNSGTYTVRVEDSKGCVNSADTDALVYAPVNGGSIEASQTICYNTIPDPITNQTAPSGGNNSFTYQWQWSTNGVDWNNLAGEESLSYTPIAALTQTTQYRREAVTACGTVYSNVITVTVRSEVLGGTIGTSQNICYNIIPNPFSNDGAPSGGSETWTYEWQYQEEGDVVWTSIPSSNNLTYTHPIGLIRTTKFRRLATDALCGFAYSNEITITVYNAINGGTIGSNQIICYGGDPDIFTDETSPSGGNGAWSYSWESKVGAGAWTPIGGALGLTYDPPAGLLTTTSYRRLATNDCGTAFSNEIIVTVYNELNGGLIGTNHAICYNGDPNNLTSTSSASGGNESFTYLWQSSTDGVIWSDISGASALSYNPPAGLTQTTQFRRRATTGCGVVYSNIVIVTVYDEVLGGNIGSSQDICYNVTPAGFTDALAPSGGNGTWVYEWQYQPNGSATWTSIAGTNSLTYAPSSGLIVTTKYRRQATNDCGTAYSNEVTVTVWDDVNGGQIGSNHSICYAGDPDAFTNETTPFGGSGIWAYSWESKVGAGAWTPIGGATGLTYDPPAGLLVTTTYRRLASNDCGTGYSNEIIVTVYNDLIGGLIGANHTICYNGDPNNLTSTSPATGGNESFTYLWQSSTDGVIWSDISGATALSYNPPAGLTQTTQFRRRATTGCGVIYSNIITVTVRDEVLGGTIANDILDICFDTQPDNFYQTAPPTGGSNSWTYEWQYQEQGQPTWTPIASSNSPSYTHPTNLTITTKFRRMATDALCGFAYSNEVEINVWENLNPGQISIADNEVCFGESPGTIQNQVSPTGGTGATTFYWEQRIGLGSWTLIGGATSDTYAVPTLTQTTSYRRWASNTCGSEHSNEITITVHPLPNQFNITGSGEYCEGSAGVAIGLDGSQVGVTYTLYLNGVPTTTTIAGTGLAISFGSQITGDYTVYAQNNATTCNIMMLGNVLVTEIPEITNNTILDNQLICSGSIPAQLTGSLPLGGKGAGTYDYQWYNSINGVDFVAISGATSQNYSPTALTQTTWYQREVISGPCSSLSNSIEVTVNQPIDNNIISAIQTICYNTSPDELTGTLPTQGSGSYTYQWQISTTSAAGPFTDIVGAELQNYLHGNLTANTWFRRIVRSLPCGENFSNVIQITVSPELLLTGFSTLPTSCSDSNDGEAEVNHTGGTAPYSYLWSNGQTTKTATGLFAGVEYTVTVTDFIGCPASGVNTVTISSPDPIEIDDLIVTSIVDLGGCFGEATGTIQVLAKGGTPNFTYSLFRDGTLIDSQTPVHPAYASFTGLIASNNYSVVVTDSRSCTPAEQNTIVLAQPDQLLITGVETVNATCFGQDNGKITITASGGSGSYIYSIIDEAGPYEVTNVFDVVSGYYFIWVMDDNGCKVEHPGNPVFVDEPEKMTVNYLVQGISSCFGALEGVIDIYEVSGGTGNYEYSIYDPPVWGTQSRFENLPGGNTNPYYIRVRDDSGCVFTENEGNPIYISQPSQITFNTTPTDVTVCWYNTNGSISVANVVGGTGTKWVSINDTDVWFQIFNSTTIRNFPNLGVGDHIIRVRDRNNGPTACEVTRVITLTGPPPIIISSQVLTHNLCFGDASGVIDATASGGAGTLNYSLLLNGLPYDGPQASGLFENLEAGDYTLEVRDDNNCLLAVDITITSPDEIVLETDITSISCSFVGNDGVIRARATGGTEPYTITLYLGGAEQDNFTGVLEGDWVGFTGLSDATDYEVIVRDANHPSCIEVSSGLLTVTVPDVLEFNPLSLASTDLSCNGASTGTITIAGQGGTLPYTYVLFDDASNQVGDAIVATNTDPVQFIDLVAGTYTVEIDDANSCGPVISAPITLIEPDAIEIDPLSISITNISCFGADDGEISLTASGGTGDLYYTIKQGGTPVVGFATQTNNGTFAPLGPGTYIIEITDDNACGPILSAELIVAEPDPLNISTVETDALCNGLTGELTAQASEGTAPYTYTLKDGADATVSVENGDIGDWVTFPNLLPGSYTLYVEDASGCENSIIVTIDEPTAINTFIDTYQDPTCDAFGNSTPGLIIADATGGTGSYTFSIYRNASFLAQNTTGTFDALAPGEYYVEVFDTNGCGPVLTGTQTLTSPTDIVIDDIIITNVLCNGETTGQIEVIVSNAVGTPLFTITADDDNWQTSNIFENLSANTYTLRVKDDNNCVITSMVTITEPDQLSLSIVPTPPTTAFDTDGSIEVNVTGGTANYWYELYIWNEGTSDWDILASQSNTPLNSHTFTNLGVGMYRVVVIDANGCEKDEVVPISQFAIVLVATNSLCHYSCEGTITLTTIGGDYVTLSWQKDGDAYDMDVHWNETGNNYINLCNGTYTAFASDDEGNEAIQSIYVGPSDPDFNVMISEAECRLKGDGIDIGSINITYLSGGNGTPANNYLRWSYLLGAEYVALDNFNDMWNLNGLPAGSYRAIYSDINGCTDTLRPVVMPIEDNIFEVLVNHEGHYCFNSQATLIGNVTNGQGVGATYEWFKVVQPNSIQVGINSSTYITETLTETTNYRLDVYSSNGCFEKRDVTINVYPEIGPFVDLANPIFKNTEHFNDPKVISVLADTEYPIEILTQNADYTLSYSWNLPQFLNPSNEKSSTLLFKTGTYEDFLTGQIFNERTQKNEQFVPLVASVQSEFNCVETFDLKAIILNRIVISNVFSPNGDGINDIWLIPHVAAFPNLEVKVLNRWGAIVWSAKGSAAAKGWDGNNSNGKPYPIGTYYYVINFNVEGSSKWKPISGSVTIVR